MDYDTCDNCGNKSKQCGVTAGGYWVCPNCYYERPDYWDKGGKPEHPTLIVEAN